MKLPVALSLVVLAFAGCTGTEGNDDAAANGPRLDGGLGVLDVGDATGEPVLDLDAGVPVPVWSVGDWWQYQVDFASGESYDAKVVVYAEDGANYYVTADDRELILRAAFTHYPTIGAVAKASLDQVIHGVEVAYLQFPMKNGTWQAPFRDFTGAYATTFTMLATGQGEVPGFATTMRNAADGNVRISHGWSPVAKWFTNFTFDFDGVAPSDVTYTLRAWGSNFTGELPLVEVIDKVHRMFPRVDVTAPGPAASNPHEPFRYDQGTLLLGAFWGGAPGEYHFCVNRSAPEQGSIRHCPGDITPQTDAVIHFTWDEMAGVFGDWVAYGASTTQGFGLLFGEVYELRDGTVTLPAP